MPIQYQSGERANILNSLAAEPHYFYMYRGQYPAWGTVNRGTVGVHNISDECVRDLVASGYVSYGQPGQGLTVTELGQSEISGVTESSKIQEEAVALAAEAAIPELTLGEAKFLFGVRLGQVFQINDGNTWSFRVDGLEEIQIDESDRESRFPGMTDVWMGVSDRRILTLTPRGHEVLAAWESSRKLEDLANNSDPLVGGRVHKVPVDDDEIQKDGGFPVVGLTDEAEYEELAAAAARALWLSGVCPADKKAVFTHAQLVDGLGMLPTGVKITNKHRTVKDRD